jgi:non-structural maintenance of chromosomes element 4
MLIGLVRTTAIAVLDSSLFVRTSDLAKRKAQDINFGEAGLNINQYISKLVSRMGGGHLYRGRELIERDRSREMDWNRLGRLAVGIARRPPTLDFMLGPLSVEKKGRRVTQRQAKENRNTDIIRPQQVPFSFVYV